MATLMAQGTAQTCRNAAARGTSSRSAPRLAAPALPPRMAAFVSQQRMKQRSSMVTRAVETDKPKVDPAKPEVAKIADSIGLPTEDGLFGFVPFSEVWVGRLAMMGFLTSLVEEFVTGKGTLQQIGVATPSPAALWTIVGLSGGLTLFATVQTLVKAQSKSIPPKQAERYKAFFGIQPDSELNAEADKLKQRGDFTSPDNYQDIADAKAAGSPADKFLDVGGEKEAMQAAQELKQQEQRASEATQRGPSMSLQQRDDIVEQTTAQSSEWAYAREVEVTNGRFAALGFLACIIVEAATGRGILGQIVLYLKMLNVLGPASGF